MSLNESLSITCVENWVPCFVCMPRCGRLCLKDIKQICRLGEHKRAAAGLIASVTVVVSCSPLHPDRRSVWGLFPFWRGRQTAWAQTWSVSAPLDCQSPVLRVRKSSRKNYHLSKQSICLLGATGRKVRGNPRNTHFGLRLWQGVTLSAYTGLLYAEHILKRHLSGAPVLGSDSLWSGLTHEKSWRVHGWNGEICKNMRERHAVELMPLNLGTYAQASVPKFVWNWTQAKPLFLYNC